MTALPGLVWSRRSSTAALPAPRPRVWVLRGRLGHPPRVYHVAEDCPMLRRRGVHQQMIVVRESVALAAGLRVCARCASGASGEA